MYRQPPGLTLPNTLFPTTTLSRSRLADEFRLPVDKHVRRIPIALPHARRIGGHTLAVDIDRLREPLRLVGIIEFARRRGERAVEAALPRTDAARDAEMPFARHRGEIARRFQHLGQGDDAVRQLAVQDRKSTRLNSSH